MSPIPEERPIAQLLGDAFSELVKLIHNEIDLARAELRAKVDTLGAATKLIAAGASLLIPAWVLILLGVASGLVRLGVSNPLAQFCCGVGAAIVAFALIWAGLSRLSANALRPSTTLEEIRRNKIVAEELMR